MSGAVSYRALMRGQTPDGIWHEPGAVFTTEAEEGVWMQPLDKDGSPVPKQAKPKAEKKAPEQDAIALARHEVGEAAQTYIDGLVADHAAKLKAETDRADVAEGALAKARGENADLLAKLKAFDADGNGQPGGSKTVNPPALSGKSKADLLEIAKAENVVIEEGATNDDIKSAIELAREEAAKK